MIANTEAEYQLNCELAAGVKLPDDVRRIALAVEYNGTDFHGFQRQKSGVVTVQGQLEVALSAVAAEPIKLVCAGRTDTGVHATSQIVHFDTRVDRPEKAWMLGARANMSRDITIRWAREVSPQFHARFSAQARTYRYVICNSRVRPALMSDQMTWSRFHLDIERMRKGAKSLVGRHDFTSFRAAQCQANHPVREILRLDLVEKANMIVMEIQATAFLHHMVRNIVGVLMAVGNGEEEPEWVAEVLAARNRCVAGVTAPSNGLYLVAVGYPEKFGLPDTPPGPCFLPEPIAGLTNSPL